MWNEIFYQGIMPALSVIGSALFMVVFFGLCVFIHELGHFLAAKACGLHVVAFSIGFKKIWGKKIGGVEYRIGCIPFGGYVDLPQIDATGDPKDENGNPLPKASPWARIVSAFAGPLFNILFGLFLGCFIWIYGLPQDTPKMKEFKVLSVEEDSPEYRAGLRKGDVIVKLNGKKFENTWSGLVRDIMLDVGDTRLDILRDGKPMQIVYQTVINQKVAPEEGLAYPFFRPEIPVIVFPEKGSPAAEAGLLAGDRVVKVNGREIYGADELESLVLYSCGKELSLSILRNGTEEKEIKVIPVPDPKMPEPAYMLGILLSYEKGVPEVESVNPGMPAENILKKGDLILKADGKMLDSSFPLNKLIAETKDAPVILTVQRGEETLDLTLRPEKLVFGRIGVGYMIRTYPNPIQQFENVLVLTYKSLRGVLTGIRNKLGFEEKHTTLKPSHFSGPIGIGRYLFVSVHRGSLLLGINLVVLITYNLGLLNLMPIPVLDGGHIVLALYELVFRRPLPAKWLQPVTVVFVAFLVMFMLFVSVFDVKKMFGL